MNPDKASKRQLILILIGTLACFFLFPKAAAGAEKAAGAPAGREVIITFREDADCFEETASEGMAYGKAPPRPREPDDTARFLGWGTGIGHPGGEAVVKGLLESETVVTGSLELQAFWGRDVLFEGNGGVFQEGGDRQKRTVARGYALERFPQEPMKRYELEYPENITVEAGNYSFMGWEKDGALVSPEAPYWPAAPAEILKALWEKPGPPEETVTVTFFVNQVEELEKLEAIVLKEVPKGALITRFPVFYGAGIKVSEWTALEESTEVWSMEQPVTSDLSLYPIVSPRTYEVVYRWFEAGKSGAEGRTKTLSDRPHGSMLEKFEPDSFSVAYTDIGEDGIPRDRLAEYTFQGWWVRETDVLWNFETDCVFRELNLDAEYAGQCEGSPVSGTPADYVRVSFFPRGSDKDQCLIYTVPKGKPVGSLRPEGWKGHSFQWWSQKGHETIFDFTKNIEEDMAFWGWWEQDNSSSEDSSSEDSSSEDSSSEDSSSEDSSSEDSSSEDSSSEDSSSEDSSSEDSSSEDSSSEDSSSEDSSSEDSSSEDSSSEDSSSGDSSSEDSSSEDSSSEDSSSEDSSSEDSSSEDSSSEDSSSGDSSEDSSSEDSSEDSSSEDSSGEHDNIGGNATDKNGSGSGGKSGLLKPRPAVRWSDEGPAIFKLTESQSTLSPAAVQALLAQNQTTDVVLQGENIIFTFAKGSMKAGPGGKIYDFGVTFSDSDLVKKMTDLAGTTDILVVRYHYSGQLPARAKIQILAGVGFAGKTLYYYYFDPELNKLVLQQSATADENGWVTVYQDRCSSYVIAQKNLYQESVPILSSEEFSGKSVAFDRSAANAASSDGSAQSQEGWEAEPEPDAEGTKGLPESGEASVLYLLFMGLGCLVIAGWSFRKFLTL